MAKNRYVNTKFWSDGFIVELDPLERYLFLFLLTNEHTNIAGVYELPLRVMAFESGIDKEMLQKMLARFSGKIEYIDGWVCIKNFTKHQNTASRKVVSGIEANLKNVPSDVIDKLIGYGYPIDRQRNSIIYSNFNLTKLNLTKLNLIKKEIPSPKEKARDFFSKGEVYKNARQKLLEIASEQAVDSELSKFSDYWTEKNSTGTKERWQMQKTFEVEKRLGTWLRNVSKFTGTKSRGKQIV